MPLTNEATTEANRLIERAKEVLRQPVGTSEELFKLAKALKGIQKFNLARRILELASKRKPASLERKILQQLASCTEKDPDLPLDRRYQKALKIIEAPLHEAEQFLISSVTGDSSELGDLIYAHQETFGISGAIHKRWWQVDAQVRHLVESQELYGKGWELAHRWSGQGIPDQGYTGINAAFVLDLLAYHVPADPALVEKRRGQAATIRKEIQARLGVLNWKMRGNWWTLVTLAEACFGLRDYKGARRWLAETKQITNPPERWEYETTAKQLAYLARIERETGEDADSFAQSEAGNALRELVGADEAGLQTAFNGKVGLALSGGGFRASLFHIGVLARLAELDMLRHIEVLSCVSGGSIIGAFYYLKLRTLLESKPDGKIERQHYIDLVREMEDEFTAAIQDNPRMRIFSNLRRLGTRTDEMGKLLDKAFYTRAAQAPKDSRPELRSLKIHPPASEVEVNLPKEERTSFVPKYDNWRRANKVPILILNATTLNTGHNWQFTATFMGESPNQIVQEVDGNERLRRMYFDEKMPEEYKKLPLGLAVAASAAVPGLFRPVRLANLYEKRDVELVDGGVHDNQGVAGLLEQDCNVILVSDASGQLVAELNPSRLETSVLPRSNNILMARVREMEYRHLIARKEAGLLRELLFVHLKKNLAVEPRNWLHCDLAKEETESQGVSPESDAPTSYDVRAKVQNLLAGIRTDLDVFCEAEAKALMSSGYRMTTHYFPESITSFSTAVPMKAQWSFEEVDAFLSGAPLAGTTIEPYHAAEFGKILRLGSSLLFKGPQLLRNYARWKWAVFAVMTLGTLLPLVILGIVAVAGLFSRPILLLLLLLWLTGAMITAIVLAIGGLYRITCWFDGLYLEKGSLHHLLRPKSPRPGH